MTLSLEPYYKNAVELLHSLVTPEGILASTIEADNYKRIWARDSMVCGLAGLLIDDTVVINGLKNSLLTLAKHQHELGMIPSNVLPNGVDVSFGSLVGRVDTNTWFIVGSCLYYQKTLDEAIWNKLLPAIERSRSYLKTIEFNNRGWIYTPLSGNWADEYPVHGYTLYDNTLRFWGESLYQEITSTTSEGWQVNKERLMANFWPLEETLDEMQYHKTAFLATDKSSLEHFVAFVLPGIYDTRFDAAGNALALFQFDLSDLQKGRISQYVQRLSKEISKPLIPAFWPVIYEDSNDWNLLKGNYSFSFKNTPGNFHNGGIWPVWMGLFCLGLARQGLHSEVEIITTAFIEAIAQNPGWDFHEYFNANSLKADGKTQMGYTASGIVFMQLAIENRFNFF